MPILADNHNRFQPKLHGLRGLAALAVVLFHWASTYPVMEQAPEYLRFITGASQTIFNFGWIGVLLFFVLSGYLLGGRLLNTSLTSEVCKSFWLRRCLRIFPAVWLQYAVLLLLAAVGVKGITAPNGWLDSILNFFLLINLPPVLPRAINLVWWTLPIELSFYAVLPLLILAIRKMGWINFGIVTFIGCVLWRASIMYLYREEPSYGPIQPILDLLPGALFSFTAGMCVAAQPRQLNHRALYGWLATAIGLLLAMCGWLSNEAEGYWTGHWMLAVWNPLISAALSVLVLCSTYPLKWLGFLATRPAVWLGEISFGIYLWHYPILVIINKYLPHWKSSATGGLLAFAVTMLGSLLLAQLSFWLIEKPAMNSKRKTKRPAC
ncbi:acyltransferase [uncultured Gilvimarinus sp.]|uniref:acyltransferase family protein n=1 Tax=uncultured Gilvimarinus sp. TaxID=1689143 RepID=UPI0030D75AB3